MPETGGSFKMKISAPGNSPAHKLFDLIDIQRKADSEGPARSFKDYTVTVGNPPAGVEIIEML